MKEVYVKLYGVNHRVSGPTPKPSATMNDEAVRPALLQQLSGDDIAAGPEANEEDVAA